FFSSRRRHTRSKRDWSSDVCSSDLSGKARSWIMYLLYLPKRSPITSSSGRSKYFSDCDTTRSSLFKCGFYYFRVCSHLRPFQTPHFFQSNNVWVGPFHPLKL